MNESNQISKTTKLYGYIGEYAGVSRFSVVLNKIFKQNNKDAMMIPMNIREDDLYFTISGMKQSHLNGAVIAHEYMQNAVELLDESSGLVKKTGICDIIFKEGQKLRGDLFSLRGLLESLKDVLATKIAIIGINPYAKAFSLMSCGFNVSYFHDNLEELMEFTQEMEISEADINRIADDMNIDFSNFDAVLDFSNISNFDMIEKLAKYNFDMKNSKEYSPLKTRAKQLEVEYISVDDMVDNLTKIAYRALS